MTFEPVRRFEDAGDLGEDDEVDELMECANCGDEFETGEEGPVSRGGEVFCSEDCRDSYYEEEDEEELEGELEDEDDDEDYEVEN